MTNMKLGVRGIKKQPPHWRDAKIRWRQFVMRWRGIFVYLVQLRSRIAFRMVSQKRSPTLNWLVSRYGWLLAISWKLQSVCQHGQLLGLYSLRTKAIGHSTNLIGEDSNIIVIRGGHQGRSVFEQMVQALQDFFPDSDVLKDEFVHAESSQFPEASTPYTMRRLSSGIASIVGENNGRRPGGYVLVVDGTALGYVGLPWQRNPLALTSRSRHLQTIGTKIFCSASERSAKALFAVVYPHFRKPLSSGL